MAQSKSSGVKVRSKSLVEAIDRLAVRPNERASRSVVEALDRLGARVGAFNNLANLAVPPYERVVALSAEGVRKLHGSVPPDQDTFWYYHVSGLFTDLTRQFTGTGKLESVLSWFVKQVGPAVFDFPDDSLARPPFDAPPASGYKGVNTHADTLGTTKTHLVFPDGSSLVSIGVNQTKLQRYSDGNAQLFETNTEVIATGTGQFAGARGLVTSDLGYYFDPLVDLNPNNEPFKSGYRVKIFVFIRLTTRS